MSDPVPPAAPPVTPDPAQAHESIAAKAAGWFRHEEQALAPELKAALRGHAGQVWDLAAKLIGRPEVADLLPEVLALAESAAKVGAITL